ncbi:alpha/beta hydrolase-fold protein [Mastigocoleus sp. MO_188.B34]|uniref:alpha/beta hydrolase n=1 Tax=Mastigocoleus sp. MO_188.B34 TaxID=3036635 RepID=UPI00262C2C92|nr:alpha/beta hydrolase-fold protein [Mastigocoleus sp. MO_188.B34]MDJ0697868.1 alpha/beta hydrolase-fold protein [Mastigocoleus sp. MO_188.B34]
MNPFYLNGQLAWYHDEGDDSGYFHTYDALVIEHDRDMPRKIHVFLPRNYSADGYGYPVVYMNDGNTTFWPDGLSPYSWEVPKTLSKLYQKQEIQPIIVVAIHPLNRSHEYLHVKEFSAPFKREGGGLFDYGSYLVRLKNFIDCSYNTLKSNHHTAIVGSSHGGLAAFHTGCVYGEYFGKVGALSPSFWAGGVLQLQQTSLISQLDRFLEPSNHNRPQIWIDWGCQRLNGFHNLLFESQAACLGKSMVNLLQQKYNYVLGKDLFKYEDLIGGHDERAWAYRFGLLLKQYYKLDN